MVQQVINVGSLARDGTGDDIRTGFIKSNLNFYELYQAVGNLQANPAASSSSLTSGTVSTLTVSGNLTLGGSLTVGGGIGTSGQVLTSTGSGLAWANVTSGGSVLSVNGQTGVVTLAKSDVGLGSVDNTSDADKPVSSATQTALNAKLSTSGGSITTITVNGNLTANGAFIASGNSGSNGQVLTSTGTGLVWANATGTVLSVNGQSGVVVLTKSDVGLANVDNTSDIDKPISTATQTALNAKEATITGGTTAQYWRGDKTFQTLDKAAVGLSNVDNTSDASKPVSTATQTALNLKANSANPLFTGTVDVGNAAVSTGGTVGSPGQVLASTGTGVQWVSVGITAGSSSNVRNSTATIGTTQAVIDSVVASGLSTVEYIVSAKDTVNSRFKSSRIALTTDGTNVYFNEYGVVLSNTNFPVCTLAADVSGGSVRLLGTGDSASVAVSVQRVTLGTSTIAGDIAQTQGGNVFSVAGRTGAVTLTKTDVGLSNVDNTSDASKPISTATQTALNAKEGTITSGTTAQYWRGDKTFQTLDKSAVGLANVDNTSDLNKPISTATQTALDTKLTVTGGNVATLTISGNLGVYGSLLAAGSSGTTGQILSTTGTGLAWINAPIGNVTSVSGRQGDVVLTKSDVGLSNVDNTSDVNKPISTATQTALNAKEPTISAGTIAQFWRGDKTWQTLDKTAVGLANVDNTSDANKPISTATQTALNGKEASITTGTTAQYWRGDKTFQTLDKTAVGLSNVDNTSDANKPVSTATQTALDLKANLASPIFTGTVNVGNATVLANGSVGTSGQVLASTGTGVSWVSIGITASSSSNIRNVSQTVTTSPTVVDTIVASGLSTVEFLVSAKDITNSRFKSSRIVITTDGTSAFIAEYGVVLSNTSFQVCTFTADVNAGNIRLIGTGDSTNVAVSVQRVTLGTSTVPGDIAQTQGGNVFSVNSYTGAVVLAKSDIGLANVDNTSDVNKPISTATQTALNGKEASITAGTTAQYWRGDKSFQTLDKTAVGLANVDNTSDASKPVSTATQTALNGKEASISAGTTGQYWRGDKSFQTLDKTAVGLSNVDNTSDANKPVSTATQTALNGKLNLTGGTLSGQLTTAVGDSNTGLLVSGSTKAIRLVADTGGSKIEGVDNTGTTSYQPLYLGGSFLGFTIGNSEKMRLDTNGRLGIGRTDPQNLLDIYTSANGSDGLRVWNNNTGGSAVAKLQLATGTGNAYIDSMVSDNAGAPYYRLAGGTGIQAAYYDFPYHIFRSQGGTERMRVDTSGNVGIGTNSPAYLLDVNGTARVFGQFEVSGGSSQAWPLFNFNTVYDGNTSGGFKSTFAGWAAGIQCRQDVGGMSFLTSGAVGNAANHSMTERMTINPGGELGIGMTASSGIKLDVSGTIRGSTEIISSTTAPSGGNLRMISGNYGALWRNDGANLYLLFTASADQYGTWNSLRPITVDVTNGQVSIGHTLAVNGAVIAGGSTGTSGQVLTSTGTGVQWAAAGGYTPPSSNISNIVFTGLTTTQAAVNSTSTTGVSVIHYEVCAIDTVNSRQKGSRITIVSDGTTATMTEYGVVKSNASFNVATFACDISAGNIRLLATGDSSSVTVVLNRTTLGTGTTASTIARV